MVDYWNTKQGCSKNKFRRPFPLILGQFIALGFLTGSDSFWGFEPRKPPKCAHDGNTFTWKGLNDGSNLFGGRSHGSGGGSQIRGPGSCWIQPLLVEIRHPTFWHIKCMNNLSRLVSYVCTIKVERKIGSTTRALYHPELHYKCFHFDESALCSVKQYW